MQTYRLNDNLEVGSDARFVFLGPVDPRGTCHQLNMIQRCVRPIVQVLAKNKLSGISKVTFKHCGLMFKKNISIELSLLGKFYCRFNPSLIDTERGKTRQYSDCDESI